MIQWYKPGLYFPIQIPNISTSPVLVVKTEKNKDRIRILSFILGRRWLSIWTMHTHVLDNIQCKALSERVTSYEWKITSSWIITRFSLKPSIYPSVRHFSVLLSLPLFSFSRLSVLVSSLSPLTIPDMIFPNAVLSIFYCTPLMTLLLLYILLLSSVRHLSETSKFFLWGVTFQVLKY